MSFVFLITEAHTIWRDMKKANSEFDLYAWRDERGEENVKHSQKMVLVFERIFFLLRLVLFRCTNIAKAGN